MNYQQKDWLGSWQNFESYLVSTAPAMQACWTQAEEAAKALPMFQAGVKTFWQRACGTALAGPVLGGWQIEAANAQDLRITCWMLPVSRWTAPFTTLPAHWKKGWREKSVPSLRPPVPCSTRSSAACWPCRRCRSAPPVPMAAC